MSSPLRYVGLVASAVSLFASAEVIPLFIGAFASRTV